jgi:hypothetical protein
MVWQTSTGWHFTDTFFRNHQTKHGPFATADAARRAWYGRLAYHGFKILFT